MRARVRIVIILVWWGVEGEWRWDVPVSAASHTPRTVLYHHDHLQNTTMIYPVWCHPMDLSRREKERETEALKGCGTQQQLHSRVPPAWAKHSVDCDNNNNNNNEFHVLCISPLFGKKDFIDTIADWVSSEEQRSFHDYRKKVYSRAIVRLPLDLFYLLSVGGFFPRGLAVLVQSLCTPNGCDFVCGFLLYLCAVHICFWWRLDSELAH